ncbi:hypothetical protein [Bacillus massilinigeriensis]|uniref:hypothetical protein n=1 Tax=Bacillus mediterraneensis TaxID=1805474 RepID=UPI0008F822A7|nr:hypothetical protein [Bacillus mediterraneensis]
MFKKLLIGILVIGILSGCGGEDKVTEDKIKKEAITYINETEDETFIPKNIKYRRPWRGDFVLLWDISKVTQTRE